MGSRWTFKNPWWNWNWRRLVRIIIHRIYSTTHSAGRLKNTNLKMYSGKVDNWRFAPITKNTGSTIAEKKTRRRRTKSNIKHKPEAISSALEKWSLIIWMKKEATTWEKPFSSAFQVRTILSENFALLCFLLIHKFLFLIWSRCCLRGLTLFSDDLPISLFSLPWAP